MEDHDVPVTAKNGPSKAQIARTRAQAARKAAEEARTVAEAARKAAEAVEETEAESAPDSSTEPSAGNRNGDILPVPSSSDSASTDEDEQPNTGPDELGAGTRQIRSTMVYRTAIAITGVVALAAGALSIFFAVTHHTAQSNVDDDVAIVQAARAQVVNLLTVNKDDVNGYSDRVLDGSTGEWHDEFTKNKDAVVEALAQSSEPTVGRVVQAGIEGEDGDTASVLVSANTAAASAPEQPGTSVRLRVNVTEVDGQLKLSKVEVVR